MEQKDIDKMWNIDSKLWVGEEITDKQRQFYNDMLEDMKEEMRSDYYHWKDFHELP